jgi:uncharacterized RDD family membrane protein YckC
MSLTPAWHRVPIDRLADERAIVKLDNTVEVETPEHVRFSFHVAGPTRRALAYLVDWLVRVLAFVAVQIVMLLVTGTHLRLGRAISNSTMLLFLFLVEWGYFVFFEAIWNGTTPGKRLVRLRVVKAGGYPLSFADAVLRNLLRAADFLPAGYVLGVLVMAWDGRFARLGDRAAGTMVVIEDPVRVAPSITLDPPASIAELASFPPRVILSLAEREAIELLLRRRDLSPARRSELAETAAATFASRAVMKSGDPVRFLALLYFVAVGNRAGKIQAGVSG